MLQFVDIDYLEFRMLYWGSKVDPIQWPTDLPNTSYEQHSLCANN